MATMYEIPFCPSDEQVTAKYTATTATILPGRYPRQRCGMALGGLEKPGVETTVAPKAGDANSHDVTLAGSDTPPEAYPHDICRFRWVALHQLDSGS